MRGHIPEEKIDEIKKRADIVDVISAHVTLRRAGKNLIGLCPFHQEKTPSFTVTPDKQIFYCFGCAQGGNALDFLMKINHMTFPEALRYLAGKTGVILPSKALSPDEKERLTLREQILRINQTAAALFSRNLSTQTGTEAVQYLKKRGVKDDATNTFHLGYAVDSWRHLRDHLERQKIPLKLAEQAGLLITKEDGGSYDRFRGRLTFPITDVNGHVIAFGGRIMGDGEPKYLNSPESTVYIKGKHLYGLYQTKDDIRKKGFAILVEGYFDLISLWNAGITNVVASLGTALTRDQVTLLRRYTTHAVAVFDPDEAGKKAVVRSLELFLAESVTAQAAILPEGYDPDDYIRTFGRECFEKIVSEAPSIVDYYIENVIGKTGTLERDLGIIRNAVPFIVKIPDSLERNLFIKRVSEKLGLDQVILKKEVQKASGTSTPDKKTPRAKYPMGKVDMVELNLIHIMMEYPDKIPDIVNSGVLNRFLAPELKEIGEGIQSSFTSNGRMDPVAFVDQIAHHPLRERLLELMVHTNPYDEAMLERIMRDSIQQVKRKWYREKHKGLKQQLQKAQEKGDLQLCSTLLREKEQLLKEEKNVPLEMTHH